MILTPKLSVFVIALSVFIIAEARHMRSSKKEECKPATYDVEKTNNEGFDASIYSEYAKAMERPYRFVPLNRDNFYKISVPCKEEGYKRDVMGICREVWDE